MVQTPLAHPDSDQLVAFSLGLLDDDSAAVVHQHLADCSPCRQVVETVPPDSLLSLLQKAITPSGNALAQTPLPARLSLATREQDASGGNGPVDLPQQFGRYAIVRRLGQGGMGAVYLAEDTQLNRLVALKVPHFRPGAGAQVYERFYREARAAAAFDHPNLCPIYDVGAIGGVHYLTMPFIDGQALAELIEPARPMQSGQAAEVIRKLALALNEAHARGVVHRDLKPSNILINQRQEPVIMDFGLARLENQDEARLTAPGLLLGTPAYMAPEQVMGEVDRIGPASDIYSLGVILYELLTGVVPFRGSVTAVLTQIAIQEPEAPSKLRPDIDPALEAICLRALAKKPEDRFPSMAALAEALASYLKGLGTDQNLSASPFASLVRNPPATVVTADASTGVDAAPASAVAAQESLRPSRRRTLVGTTAVAGALLLGAVIYVATDHGQVKITLNDPQADVQITVDGNQITLAGPDETIRLKTGKHNLQVTGANYQTVTDTFTIRRGETNLVHVELQPRARAAAPAEKKPERGNDYMDLARGKWRPILTGPGDTVKLGSASFKDGVVEVQPNGFAYDLAYPASDMIIRAQARKVWGQNINLRLRVADGSAYVAWYNGNGWFGLGRETRKGWTNLPMGGREMNDQEFFEFAFATVGDTLTVYADGHRILQVRDNGIRGPGVPGLMTTNGVGLFKNIEVQVLDANDPAKPEPPQGMAPAGRDEHRISLACWATFPGSDRLAVLSFPDGR